MTKLPNRLTNVPANSTQATRGIARRLPRSGGRSVAGMTHLLRSSGSPGPRGPA